MLDVKEVNEFMLKTYRLLREKLPCMQAFHIRNSLNAAYREQNSDEINYCLAKIEEKLLSIHKNDQEKIKEIKDLFLNAPRIPDFNNNEDDIFRFEP